MPHSPDCSDPSLPVPVQPQCGASQGQRATRVLFSLTLIFWAFSLLPASPAVVLKSFFPHHSPEKYREVSHALSQSEPWFSSSTGSVNPRTEHSDTLLPRSTCSRDRGSSRVLFQIPPLAPCAAGGHSSWLTIQSPANLSVHTIC